MYRVRYGLKWEDGWMDGQTNAEICFVFPELLESFCPLVERLGLDENFVDVTELVEKKLKKEPLPSDVSVNGHIYNQQGQSVFFCGHVCLCACRHKGLLLRNTATS